MQKLKSHLGRRSEYTPVDASDQNQDDPENSQRDALTYVDAAKEERPKSASSWFNTRTRINYIRYIAFIEGLLIILLVIYLAFHSQSIAVERVPLGTDPSGFVPKGK